MSLVALVGVLYLTLGSETVISGYNMQQMAWELKSLQQENTKLEAQIAGYQSVEALQSRAIEMGFVPAGPDDIEYVPVNQYPPVPDEPVLESPQPSVSTQENSVSSWWQTLISGFKNWTQATAVGGD